MVADSDHPADRDHRPLGKNFISFFQAFRQHYRSRAGIDDIVHAGRRLLCTVADYGHGHLCGLCPGLCIFLAIDHVFQWCHGRGALGPIVNIFD